MGIVTGMSNEVYHSTSGISSTAVKSVYKKSLAHWKGEKRVQSAAFAMGTAVHALLLEEDRELVIKGPKTKKSKAFEEMQSNLKEDQVLLTEVEFNVANRIAKGALENDNCKKVLRHKERKNEVSIFIKDPRSGLTLKTRPDLYIESEKTVYDVKTTLDASPAGFSKECFRYAYDIQSAFYVYTCNLAGLDIRKFTFIACEKASPYLSHMHVVSSELMEHAMHRMHQTLDKIALASEKDEYGTGWGSFSYLGLPKWL